MEYPLPQYFSLFTFVFLYVLRGEFSVNDYKIICQGTILHKKTENATAGFGHPFLAG
jgi:hypothetical protein